MAKIGIFTGTVYGNALLVAEEAQPVLEAQGHEVKVFEDPSLADWQAYSKEVALIVTSTPGRAIFRTISRDCMCRCVMNWAISLSCAMA